MINFNSLFVGDHRETLINYPTVGQRCYLVGLSKSSEWPPVILLLLTLFMSGGLFELVFPIICIVGIWFYRTLLDKYTVKGMIYSLFLTEKVYFPLPEDHQIIRIIE